MKISEIIYEDSTPDFSVIQKKFIEFMHSKEQEGLIEAPIDPHDRIEPTLSNEFNPIRRRASTLSPSATLLPTVTSKAPKDRDELKATHERPKVSTTVLQNPIAKSNIAQLNQITRSSTNQSNFLTRLVKTAMLWGALYYGINAWIYSSVVNDSIKEFQITQKYGSTVDQYVHAGIVAAAMLQKGDEAGYKRWKAIEQELKPF